VVSGVVIHEGHGGPWARIVTTAGGTTWGVSAFSNREYGDGTLLTFACEPLGDYAGESVSLQADDAVIVTRWTELRAAVYNAGPTGDEVQQAIDRCRAALAEKVAADDGT